MRYVPGYLTSIIFLGISISALAQSTSDHNIGRVASDEELRNWVKPISPTGDGLPPGRGTAIEGAAIYAKSCVFCHGPDGTNGPYNGLKGTPLVPYATIIWDYINWSMPRSLANPGAQERQLSPNEVYALTAYLLHLNGLIGENDVMDAKTLPKVKIPIQSLH